MSGIFGCQRKVSEAGKGSRACKRGNEKEKKRKREEERGIGLKMEECARFS